VGDTQSIRVPPKSHYSCSALTLGHCKRNVKIRENVYCGADTPEMKYSGHADHYDHHLYLDFGTTKKLHYEGGIFIRHLFTVFKMFTNEELHVNS
jgi:hypothetical protein